jgi:hypothetical protein
MTEQRRSFSAEFKRELPTSYSSKTTATSKPAVHSASASQPCAAGLIRFSRNAKASLCRAKH